MAWQIEFSPAADKALTKLEIDTQKRIVRFMRERVANMEKFPHEWEQLTELGEAHHLSGPQAAAEILRRHLRSS